MALRDVIRGMVSKEKGFATMTARNIGPGGVVMELNSGIR